MAETKEIKRQLEALTAKMAGSKIDEVLKNKTEIKGVTLVCGRVDGLSANDLRTLSDDIKAKMPIVAVVLAANTDGRITFLATASKDAVGKGVHSGMIIKEITALAGGSGGGKPDMAQGGGKLADKIDEALKKAEEIVSNQIG